MPAEDGIAAAVASDLSRPADPMTPVFSLRLPAAPAARPLPGAIFPDTYAQSQMVQLNWIGDIHLSPVYSATNADFLLTTQPDLKSPAPIGPYAQEPTEMSAFRFQR
jgi:hypothetical protein